MMTNTGRSRSRAHGMTLWQMALVLVVFVGALVLAWVGLTSRPRPRPPMRNMSSLKNIHQGMYRYAQDNGDYFPGLDSRGRDVDLTVEGRLKMLLDSDHVSPEDLISSAESKSAWKSGTVTSAAYSYALLAIPAAGGRRDEWSGTSNSQAVVMSDRNTGADGTPENVQSIWTNQPGDWRGSVCWNDNHVSQETTQEMENAQYGKAPALADDSLFLAGDGKPLDESAERTDADDALMIYSGK